MLSYLAVSTDDVLNTNNNKTEFIELRRSLKNLLRLSSNYCTLAMNIRSYTGFINLCAEGGYCDPGRKRLLVPILGRKAFGEIKTTGNIRILPSSSIYREIWNKSIIFIGI